ncbi:MAG: hypothetical protein PWQ67_1865 [Clostridia bacterium]|jgi:hypothetical protein|nr:hypothetical protein [Clostridia bacterium]MDN5323411.1 hypothetical protein [Clostridia bacterium]
MLETNVKKKPLSKIEIIGLVLVGASLLGLFFAPNTIAGIFDAMVNKAQPIIVKVFLTGTVGVAIIVSVMIGRILERLGFTDALLRIFVPIMKFVGVNSAVVIPSVYNILGDINAAGRIAAPILRKAGATKDEQKIAIATMVQSQQSFSTFMFGMIAMTAVGINVFPVIIIVIFLPLILVPWLLSKTIYRDTKSVALDELPSFTPSTPAIATVFGAAREGAELLFLLIIPIVGAIFAIIGALDYVGIWKPIEAGLSSLLTTLSIDPKTGIVSILASPTLAMAQLKEAAAGMNPALVLGSFVLASSGFPFSVIFGQIPAIWTENSDLNEKEAMFAAILGAVMRMITAGIIAVFLTPLFT